MNIETIYDQGSGKMNEDAILVQEPLFGVFDGATGLDKRLYNGKTGGYLAASIVKEFFKKNEGDLRELGIMANQVLDQEMKERGLDLTDASNRWATTAAVVKIKDDSLEWFQVADSPIIFIFSDGSSELIIGSMPHIPELKVKWKEMSDRGLDWQEKWNLIRPDVVRIRQSANTVHGTINGDPKMKKFISHSRRAIGNITHILLLTDGFEIPNQDPRSDYNLGELVSRYQISNLEAVKEYIRELENSDPECRHYLRFKPHDDMAGIAITI